ncbi:MAG: hypothetical protein IH895_05730 [Planctomycetes bacterium]|nr:hypothetical protein [Planctomycetota bacterium]
MQQTHWPIRLVILLCVGGAALAGAGCAPGDGTPNGNGNANGNANQQDDECLAEGSFQLAPSRQAVAFVDPACFSDLLKRSEIEPTLLLQASVEQFITRFAGQFPNDADFVLFTLDAHREQLRFNAVGGFNIAINVPEAGLGPFVSVSSFPTLPNLRSYIYLARKDSLVLGPSLHELAHGWGVRFITPDALAQQASQSDNHWGFTSAGGQLGGWMPGTLMDLGDGEFELSSGQIETGGRSFNTVPFSAIELYLMGLAEQDEVKPLQVAVNPVPRSLFEFVADDIVEVTIEDIIAANGARVPSTQDAQKAFKIALIVLTDHLLSDREWDFYQDSIDYFSFDGGADINEAFPESRYAGQPIRELIAQPDLEDPSREFMNFFEATRGRATIEFIPLQATGP